MYAEQFAFVGVVTMSWAGRHILMMSVRPKVAL